MKKTKFWTILSIVIIVFCTSLIVDWIVFTASDNNLQNEPFFKVLNSYYSRYPFGIGQFFENNIRMIGFIEILLLLSSSVFLFSRGKIIFIIIGVIGVLTAFLNAWSLL